jgi:hypothetical protein
MRKLLLVLLPLLGACAPYYYAPRPVVVRPYRVYSPVRVWGAPGYHRVYRW